jgi:hypothetical protein
LNFSIQVVQVDKQFKPTDKGGYTQLEVAFKNLSTGKLESKKLMSFTKPEGVYKALVDAKQGDTFNITSNKNEKSGYWDWVAATQGAPDLPQQQPTKTTGMGNASPKSTYETPEERAKKQVYIVRQSSISNAIELLSVGAKAPPKLEDVLKVAQDFTDFVFQQQKEDVFNLPNDLPQDVEVE